MVKHRLTQVSRDTRVSTLAQLINSIYLSTNVRLQNHRLPVLRKASFHWLKSMVTINQAKEIALNLAKLKGEFLPGIYYGIDKGKEYSKCFYFNFPLVDKEGVMPIELPMAGQRLLR